VFKKKIGYQAAVFGKFCKVSIFFRNQKLTLNLLQEKINDAEWYAGIN
jgi:hypothetical protein